MQHFTALYAQHPLVLCFRAVFCVLGASTAIAIDTGRSNYGRSFLVSSPLSSKGRREQRRWGKNEQAEGRETGRGREGTIVFRLPQDLVSLLFALYLFLFYDPPSVHSHPFRV